MAYSPRNPNGQTIKANSMPTVPASDYQMPVLDYDIEVSGTVNANNTAAFSQNAFGYSWVNFQITGTWSGTLSFQVSNDGTNWNSVAMMSVSNTASAGSTTATGNGQLHGTLTAKFFRVYSTAWSSGTATVSAVFSSFPGAFPSVGGQVAITGNQVIGPSPTTSAAAMTLTAGTTYSQTYAGALTVVKASAARMFEFEFENSTGADVWFQIFSATTTGAVTLGTTVPVRSIRVPANSQRDWSSTYSPSFAGIVIAATTARFGNTVATGPFSYWIGMV